MNFGVLYEETSDSKGAPLLTGYARVGGKVPRTPIYCNVGEGENGSTLVDNCSGGGADMVTTSENGQDHQDQDELLDVGDVASLLKVCAATVVTMTRRGMLPPPRHLGRKARRWVKSEIVAYLRALPTKRNGTNGTND
jgi:predicted DNA-binding transcriptional regulator AlpA